MSMAFLCKKNIPLSLLLTLFSSLLSAENNITTCIGDPRISHASAVLEPLPVKNNCELQPFCTHITNIQTNELLVIKLGPATPIQQLSPDSFSVFKNSKSRVSVKVCRLNDVIILKPDSSLDPFSAYTVTTNPHAADHIENLIPSYSWSFTTGGAPPPLLGRWEENMVKYGDKWGRYLESYHPKPLSYNETRGIYYDAQRVYLQIATYTETAEPWESYAGEAERVYRTYLDSRKWITQGWRKFAHGFYLDWLRKKSPSDKEALLALRDNKVFHNPEASRESWYWSHRSREIAYALDANVFAEKSGHTRNKMRVSLYVNMALSHINEWVTEKSNNPDITKHRFAPFMAGLTAEALINYYEWEVEQGHNPNDRIPNALLLLAELLWSSKVAEGPKVGMRMWVSDVGGKKPRWTDEGGTGYGAFRYENKNSAQPAPGLNLMIAPLYAWLYKHYGDSMHIERGDLIWEGGIALTNVGWNTKTFNQNYRWSFSYIEWRGEGDKKRLLSSIRNKIAHSKN